MDHDWPVGTQIRFTKDLVGEPCGDHPAFDYARKGETGWITKPRGSCREGYWVKTDRNPEFGARFPDEFEIIKS